jgi:ubiquitin-protein ligase E3 C
MKETVRTNFGNLKIGFNSGLTNKPRDIRDISLRTPLTHTPFSYTSSVLLSVISYTMIPIFGDDRKRKINLGGASTASSHRAILEKARAQRDERSAQKRREASAVQVQAWWRGVREKKVVQRELRRVFEADVKGLVGLRCLVLLGSRDESALGIWSREMASGGDNFGVYLTFVVAFETKSDTTVIDGLFALARQPETSRSWLVLIRQAALLLLRSVAKNPM